MSEHDDRYASSDLPRTTAEFRAAPDVSASTAEFRAFVAKQDRDEVPQSTPGEAWPEQPWAGEAKSRIPRRSIAIVAAIVAVIVVIAVIVAVG
jgi:hypothetical protein